jgi:hypothetical protein
VELNTPKDQYLFLTVFVAVSLSVILITWLLMPIYHRGEFYEGETEKEPQVGMNLVLSPEGLIEKVDAAIQTGEAALVQLEAEGEAGEGESGDPGKDEAPKP